MGGRPGAAAAEGPGAVGLLMAGPTCPDPAVTAQLETGLARRAQPWLPHARVAAALARTRAERALGQARDLFRRTDFDGCIALLSITEQELGRNLADPATTLQRRAHLLLAQINLWLGVCQWAAGDPQTAAGSFVRSAALPASPAPDPRLLPPALVEAHRSAVSAPRQEVSCELTPPIRPEHILVDGQPPSLDGGQFRVAAGTHYLTLEASCRPEEPGCRLLLEHLGGHGRSLRLEASALRCKVQVPSRLAAASPITCASAGELAEAGFVGDLTRESGAAGTVTVAQIGRRLTLQLQRRGSSGFVRQIATEIGGREAPAELVGRSLGLLLGVDAEPVRHRTEAWYQHWWIWAIVGATVVAATTSTAVAISRSQRQHEYRVVFGP